jgi:hypothetical protein
VAKEKASTQHVADAEQRLAAASDPTERKHAERELAGAKRELARATDERKKAERALAQAEQNLASATSKREKALAVLEQREIHLRAVIKKHSKGHEAEVDTMDLRMQKITRDVHVVTVNGVQVKMHDSIDAYSTISENGVVAEAEGDGHDLVEERANSLPLSSSKKGIFAGVSRHEGTFSEANTYDVAGLTYGFIQMTSSGHGGSLVDMMQFAKRTKPEAFARNFQAFGIDVDPRTNQITLTLPSGEVLRGKAAVERICNDPVYTGVFCAAGMDPDFQEAQVMFANRKLDRAMDKETKIKPHGGPEYQLRPRDVLTSEYAVGLFFDRCVQNGEGGATDVLYKIITSYIERHPGADLNDPVVKSAIEAEYVKWAEANYADRARDFRGLSTESGSYKP